MIACAAAVDDKTFDTSDGNMTLIASRAIYDHLCIAI